MTRHENSWQLHAAKAAKAREEAEFLASSGYFDGAYVRALEACIQDVRAAVVRLTDDDNRDTAARLRKCFKEALLPQDLSGPISTIMFQHSREIVTERTRTKEDATEVIALAGTLHRALSGAAAITASLIDPAVRRRAKAKGIAMPNNPFTKF